ncbi:MAG TPA: alcohol dehydrogenase catalytic domain-containing protein, partial [Gemmatimonadaceae bacterium]|nr:alcohol dehydrogenase catalytic domain-containing protein [Gemmatimonadaceae bacterium]
MKAVRVLRYGPPSVVEINDVPRPSPGRGQLLVRVEAAGVGNWDALFREGTSRLEPLPIILGSDISGTVEALGPEVSGFKPGDEVYGSTNPQFSGGQAEYAVPLAGMMAPKPKTLNFIDAA